MADTHEAASTSLAHVQAALDAAADGDTVSIPAGSSTWAGTASVDPAKKLIITGNGIGSTVINRNSVDARVFDLDISGSILSGIEFQKGYINVDGLDWRIHHCKLDNGTTWGDGISSNSQIVPAVPVRGVVDNCTFVNARCIIHGNAYLLTENDNQHRLWYNELALGSQDFFFVEDCIFSGDDMIHCIDASLAGRYVFRYNTYNCSLASGNGYACEIHSLQGDDHRAARGWEIYENTCVVTSPATKMWAIAFIRGGTGVMYNNSVVGDADYAVLLNNVRDTESRSGCLQCDGTSPWDENTTDEAGWRCRDQIGAGKDDVLGEPADPHTHQAADPAYIWGNTPAGIELHLPSTPPHIVVNRDYYASARPGYTAYTYPHPLRGESSIGTKLAMIFH